MGNGDARPDFCHHPDPEVRGTQSRVGKKLMLSKTILLIYLVYAQRSFEMISTPGVAPSALPPRIRIVARSVEAWSPGQVLRVSLDVVRNQIHL